MTTQPLNPEPTETQPDLNAGKEERYQAALQATRSPLAAARHLVQTREPKTAKSGRFARVHAVQLKQAFLEAYSKYGNIGHCSDLVGIGRNLVYSWQETDQDFALAFQQAEKRALETLEHEAWRRAVEGSPYTRTSYYRGEPVGTDHKIEYSDQLLTLLLRAKAPERYREKVDMNVSQVVKTIAGVDPASVL